MPAPPLSRVLIANKALYLIGEARIDSLDDDTKSAEIINEIYDMIRDEVLEAHPWNFALKRFSLAESSVEPLWEYDNAFPLDPSVLRVVKTDLDPMDPWAVELDENDLQVLVCNNDAVQIQAIVRIDDETKFSPKFVDAFAKRLAKELVFSMTGTKSSVEDMDKLYKDALADARTMDAQGGGKPGRISASSWKNSRSR